MRDILRLASVLSMAWLTTAVLPAADEGVDFSQPLNTWIKRSPLADTPPSPRLGYEGACVWDSWRRVMIRYGGHNQGGGGEQGSEIWTFDPLTARWELKESNTSPPGICCGQQNVFDPTSGLYIRFSAASGSHGWQWFREIYLNDSSVWTYNLSTNIWRNRRPFPAPNPRLLRCASWDSEHQVIVLFGGEGSRDGTWTYDPYVNHWKEMNPSVEPPYRSAGNMAYDATARQHVLFGAQFSNDPHTWIYDLNANTWTKLTPDPSPPTDRNCAVLTYDPHGRRVLAIVQIVEDAGDDEKRRLETWAFQTVKQEWTKLTPASEPDLSGNRARQLMFAPELNVALLENAVRPDAGRPREQQIWTYRLGKAAPEQVADVLSRPVNKRSKRQPRLVDDVVVSVVDAANVTLRWQPPADSDVTGYEVQRAVVEVFSNDQLKRIKSQTPSLASPSMGGIRRIGRFKMLTDKPISRLELVDQSIDLSSPTAIKSTPIYERRWHEDKLDENGREYRFSVYAYRVRAVNETGVAGGWSSAVLTIPSSPQEVFSREDGTACHVRWKANPEEGIVGYRVYRMDGQFSKSKIPRLTPDAIRQTTYTDEQAGKPTRRYYVVAVDALGQEGFPSAPVWYSREWKRFYAPFTDGWHQ